MSQRETILVVEDDADIGGLLKINLEDLGYDVALCTEGESGLQAVDELRPRLVILDLMLPGIDGLEICRRIRATNKHLPVMMLTARSEEFDKVLGLELGADDYLTKPFSVRELVARVKALVRRSEVADIDRSAPEAERLVYDELEIDLVKRQVRISSHEISLTAKEFDLLALFARNPGRAYSRQELLDVVWGYQYVGYSHTVNTHINRLRRKIEQDPASPRFIQTVWGVGYRFIDWPEGQSA